VNSFRVRTAAIALLAAAVSAAGAIPAWAANVPVNGAEKAVPVYQFAELSVKVEKGDQAAWQVYPDPAKLVDKGDGLVYFSGPPGAKYSVFVTVVNFDTRRFDTGKATVHFSGDAPGPGPAPEDPEAVAFLNRLKGAWAVEAADRQHLPGLIGAYRHGAALSASATTWGDLFKGMAAVATANGAAGKLPQVQAVVGAELVKRLPSKASSDVVLDAAARTLARDTLTRVADSLGGLR
jgi:hypothetical protein